MGQHLIKTKYLGHGVKLFFSYSCNTECEGGILFGVIFSVNQRHSKITPFPFIQKKKKMKVLNFVSILTKSKTRNYFPNHGRKARLANWYNILNLLPFWCSFQMPYSLGNIGKISFSFLYHSNYTSTSLCIVLPIVLSYKTYKTYMDMQ